MFKLNYTRNKSKSMQSLPCLKALKFNARIFYLRISKGLSTSSNNNNFSPLTEPAVTETLMSNYSNFSEKRFIDKLKVKVKAGRGGNGCVSFYRDRVVRAGAPDGGCGGKGGDLYLRASSSLNDLHVIKKTLLEGNNGKSAGGGKRDGKHGKDIYYNVPTGTLVYEILSDKKIILKEERILKHDYHKRLVKDLDQEGKSVLIAKGGAGGKGNARFRGLKVAESGKIGECKEIYLELKSIADVGLVGLPNVGKSSILASVSRSLPRIANYPFTTLSPLVGKIRFIDDFEFTMADIPGIIEDAHKNKGLGLEFLRHIERTKVFVYVLDVCGEENEDLFTKLSILRNEVYCYKKNFQGKPSIVVVNKCDLEADAEKRFVNLKEKCDKPCFLISAKHGFGIGEMLVKLRSLVEQTKQEIV